MPCCVLPYVRSHGLVDMASGLASRLVLCLPCAMHPLESFPSLAVPAAILHPKAIQSPPHLQALAVPLACRLPPTRPSFLRSTPSAGNCPQPTATGSKQHAQSKQGPWHAFFFLVPSHHHLPVSFFPCLFPSPPVWRDKESTKMSTHTHTHTHTTSAFAMHVSVCVPLGTTVSSYPSSSPPFLVSATATAITPASYPAHWVASYFNPPSTSIGLNNDVIMS